MPTSSQQVYLINGILVDFFGNPVYLPSSEGPTGPQGATGINGLPGITGPTGSTAATSKFIKEWISAGDERVIISSGEISQYTPGFLNGGIRQSLSDVQIQLWRVNSAFIDPNPVEGGRPPTFWQLIKPSDYNVNVNSNTGDIFIDLTYRLVNSTRTRAIVIC
jgi:hypothetical protein